MMLVIRPPGGRSKTAKTVIGITRASAFLLGATAGSAALLFSLQVISPWDTGVMASVVFASLAVLLALRDLGLVRFAMPQRRGQVKRETSLNHPLLGPVIHGFALGTAVYTFIPISLPYAIISAPVLGFMQDWTAILLTAACFALGRSISVYARLLSPNIDADEVAHRIMTRGLPVARAASAVSLGLLAGAALPDFGTLPPGG